MESQWTRSRMMKELALAEHLARLYVRLAPMLVEVAPHYIMCEDTLTVKLNPAYIGVCMQAKRTCPRWLANEIEGRKQYASDKTEGIAQEKQCERASYSVVATIILRKVGFNGHIQGELPF